MDQFDDVTNDDRDFVLATVQCHMAVKHWHEFLSGTRARYVAAIGSGNMWRFAIVCLADHTDLDEVREMLAY